MLSFHQINQVESLFLAIDSKIIDKAYFYLIDEIIDKVYTISAKQGEYLLWLLNRWYETHTCVSVGVAKQPHTYSYEIILIIYLNESYDLVNNFSTHFFKF